MTRWLAVACLLAALAAPSAARAQDLCVCFALVDYFGCRDIDGDALCSLIELQSAGCGAAEVCLREGTVPRCRARGTVQRTFACMASMGVCDVPAAGDPSGWQCGTTRAGDRVCAASQPCDTLATDSDAGPIDVDGGPGGADAGTDAGAASGSDAGASMDASPPAEGLRFNGGGGFACRVSPGPSPAPLSLWLGALALGLRRAKRA